MRAGTLVLLFLGAAHGVLNTGPVDKVVKLIEDLKTKIESEGTAEQKVYDKFACWCEKTTARKASAIQEAKTSIEKLQNSVIRLKGSTATLKAEIAGLNNDIAANNKAQKEAGNIRTNENNDYEKEKNNIEQAIGALESAIGVLTGAGGAAASALQEAQLLSVSREVQSALRVAPSDAFTSTADDKKLIEAFVRSPTDFFGKGAKFSGAQISSGGPMGDYAPASTQIQGLLKGMYDAMTSDLESKNGAEAMSQKSYEELMDVKKGELETLESSLASKTTSLGEDTKSLSEDQVERDETQTQLANDEQFFEDSKNTCRTKAENWATRTRLRTTELDGISKALKILSDGSETLGSATSMLLQSSQRSEKRQPGTIAAYSALKAIATKHHSLRLGAMAAMVQTATEGHFGVVIESVDKMIAELRQEEQDDIDLRDYCQAEENKVENEIEDLEHKITNLQGAIDRLRSKKKELLADIKQTESDITSTEDAMSEALTARNEENSEFKAALKDDEDAIEILGKAIEAMEDGQVKLIQVKKPEYAENAMPDDALDEPYGGKREGNDIVSILGYIKEDLENEVGTCKKAEGQAQVQFEEQRSAATKALNALNAKKVTLETVLAETEEKIADTVEDREQQKTSKKNKGEYRESLKPKCDWMKESFGDRRTKRREEMDGLLQAKTSLAGGLGLVQKSSSLRGSDKLVEARPWIL